MSSYQLHKPRHIKEAVDMMTNLEDARYVAGGTKIMPLIAQGKLKPKHLISLEGVADLKDVQQLNGVKLGSGLTFNQLEESDLVRKQFTALYDAISALPVSKKNDNGTLGGDLCSAYPFAIIACPMLLFDAQVAAAGMYPAVHSSGLGVKGGYFGSRIVRIDSFFPTRDTTILKQDELVKEFILPFLPEQTGSTYIKIKRNKAAYLGIAGIGARITVSAQGRFAASREALDGTGDLPSILGRLAEDGLMCKDVRLAVAYSQNLPRTLRGGEDELSGNLLSADVLDKAVNAAAGEVMSNVKAKAEAWYREEVVKVLLKRSIMKSIDRVIRPEQNLRPEGDL